MLAGMRGLAVALPSLVCLLVAARPAGAGPDTERPALERPALDRHGIAQPAPAAAPRPQMRVVRHRAMGPHPARGPRLAPVTIDFFVNPGDRATRSIHRQLVVLQRRHPRGLRIVYRLVAPGRDHDLAVAALEAFAQGRFEPFLEAVLAHPRPPRAPEDIASLCREAGVDVAKVEAAWARSRYEDALYRNEGARKRHTDKAPSLLFNGRDGGRATSMTMDRLESHYQQAHQRARAALERGVPLEHLYTFLVREHAAEQAAKIPRDFTGAVDGVPAAALRDMDVTPRLVPQDVDVPGHALGPAGAPVTLHVYCSFLSANCAMLKTSLATLREEFPDELRMIFHHMFPALPEDDQAATALRRDLLAMHRGALCADEQGAFWAYYKQAYLTQVPQTHHVSVAERIDAITARLGIDVERFAACVARDGGDDEVVSLVRAARKAGIAHTPTVVIGGRAYLGFKSSLDLRALVEEELVPGLLERAFPAAGDDAGRFAREAR